MRSSCTGIVTYIANKYSFAVEIGIGHFPDVGLALVEKGLRFFATDMKPFQYDKIEVYVDDITKPNVSLYSKAEIIYSIRPPLELIPFIKSVAREVNADMIVKPLSSEYPGGQLFGGGRTCFFLWRCI